MLDNINGDLLLLVIIMGGLQAEPDSRSKATSAQKQRSDLGGEELLCLQLRLQRPRLLPRRPTQHHLRNSPREWVRLHGQHRRDEGGRIGHPL